MEILFPTVDDQTPKVVNEVVKMFELLSVNRGVQDVNVGNYKSEYLNFEIDDLRKRISFFESLSKKLEKDVQSSESQTVEKSKPELVLLEESKQVSEVCEPKQASLQAESVKEEKTDKDSEQPEELTLKHWSDLMSKLKSFVIKVKKMISRNSLKPRASMQRRLIIEKSQIKLNHAQRGSLS